jgi:hypothetical protein
MVAHRQLLVVLAVMSGLVALAHTAPEEGTQTTLGRSLLQSGVSCPAAIPACTPRRCTRRILDNREAWVCLRCQRGYETVLGSDGRSIVQCGTCARIVRLMCAGRCSCILQHTRTIPLCSHRSVPSWYVPSD